MGVWPRIAWKLGLAAAAAIFAAYIPLRDTVAGPSVYALASLLACVAFFVGPRVIGSRGLHWRLFGIGMAFYAAADVWWAITTLQGTTLPYPSWADALYLIAYVFFVAGTAVLLRGTRPAAGDLLDGLLVAATAAFVVWPLVIAPTAETGTSFLESFVSGAYPTLDVLLLIGLAPVALATRSRCASHGALVTGFAAMLGADLVYAVLNLKNLYTDSNAINLAWIAANGCLAFAALHPSARRLDEPVPRKPGRLGLGRLVIIAAALAVGPAIGLGLDLTGHRTIDAAEPIATVTAIVLVLARIILLWRERERVERALHESQVRYRDLYALAEAARGELAAKNEELLELDGLKDQFVGLVSHELRTPLTSICGYLDLLREGVADREVAQQLRFLDALDRNAGRLMTLVNDLLFITQMQAGKVQLALGELDLAEVAIECAEAAKPLADERQIGLEVFVEAHPRLAADRSRLTQVFDNLISNALKFTPPGGRVTVFVGDGEDAAFARVRDTGIGIAPTDLRHLFEPFFRSASEGVASTPGTGLGLAISKGIVEAHGGQISAQSVEGSGTTFTIELPTRPTPRGVKTPLHGPSVAPVPARP
jgi:signal transduction histidine kinase